MELLCQAYDDDDDDDDDVPKNLPTLLKRKRSPRQQPTSTLPYGHPLPNNNYYQTSSFSVQLYPSSIATEGRYVSKKERAILSSFSSDSRVSESLPRTVSTSPVVGSIADSDLPSDILASLRRQSTVHANKIAGNPSILLNGHTNAVNSVQWSQSHAHLLASAGMDQTVHVWSVWNKDQKKARVFKNHNAAIKDVRWSPQGLSLLSCGYDCKSRLVDVEKGIEMQTFKEDQVVETIRFHPSDSNLFLSGGSKGVLKLWDIRCAEVAREYIKGLGSILDIEFSSDGKQFISSTDTSKSRISEDSIIVWDVLRQVPLSNQVYAEAYTCPCIRYHPSDSSFIAQSNGNYIAIFSSRPPYKLDRYKRYEGHGIWGFPIKCNFSLDGSVLASGSSDGCIYYYDYKSSKLVRKVKAFGDACIDVAFHPVFPSVMAACSWNGEVSVFQ